LISGIYFLRTLYETFTGIFLGNNNSLSTLSFAQGKKLQKKRILVSKNIQKVKKGKRKGKEKLSRRERRNYSTHIKIST